MKILKNIFCLIISFALILCILLQIAVSMLDNTILNRAYVTNKMREIEFSVLIRREIESGFENYIYQSGLPEDTIKDLFSDEILEKDIESILDCVYDGTQINLSEKEIKNNLDIKIQEYLKTQNKTLNEQGKSNIEQFENLIVNEYIKNINISSTLYETGHNMLSKVFDLRNKISNIPIIAIVILVILLIIINIKSLASVINYISISSLSIGILLKLAINLVYTKVSIDNIIILAMSITNLTISIVKENLYKLSDNGNFCIFFGIFGILIYALIKDGTIIEKTKKIIKPKQRNIKRNDA